MEVYHDPPLLFDTIVDPAEAFPLDAEPNTDIIGRIKQLVREHKDSVNWTYPLSLDRDSFTLHTICGQRDWLSDIVE